MYDPSLIYTYKAVGYHQFTNKNSTEVVMSVESFLENQLQRLSIIDLGLVKAVYFVIGLLVLSLYPALSTLSIWFYGILFVLCAIPLEIHLFSQPGSLLDKMRSYLKSNNPSNQTLLFLSVFFFSLFIAKLLPAIASAAWWVYLLIMIPLMIKPMTKTWFW
jgi:hypothetical protein